MKQTINKSDFINAFRLAGRSDQFSRDGLNTLFKYLEQYEQDTGEELELDVIGLCCNYVESSIEDALKEHGLDSLDDLKDNTLVLEVDDETIIYQAF